MFRVYGFSPDISYVEAVSLKSQDELDKSLRLVTDIDTSRTTGSSIITTNSSIVTTNSVIEVTPKSTKLDCAMEGIDLEGNIAIDFDVMFEDSYSEKALFRGKYRDMAGKLSWHTPSQVSIKEDNKLYIGKSPIIDLSSKTWYNLKIAFELTNNKKVVSYGLDDVKIHEVVVLLNKIISKK